MLRLECPGCKSAVVIDPDGPDALFIEWMPGMKRFDPDATFDALASPPCTCCTGQHHHGINANIAGAACRPLQISKVEDGVSQPSGT